MQPIQILHRPGVVVLSTALLLLATGADCQTARGEPPLRFQARTVATDAVLWWARALVLCHF